MPVLKTTSPRASRSAPNDRPENTVPSARTSCIAMGLLEQASSLTLCTLVHHLHDIHLHIPPLLSLGSCRPICLFKQLRANGPTFAREVQDDIIARRALLHASGGIERKGLRHT